MISTKFAWTNRIRYNILTYFLLSILVIDNLPSWLNLPICVLSYFCCGIIPSFTGQMLTMAFSKGTNLTFFCSGHYSSSFIPDSWPSLAPLETLEHWNTGGCPQTVHFHVHVLSLVVGIIIFTWRHHSSPCSCCSGSGVGQASHPSTKVPLEYLVFLLLLVSEVLAMKTVLLVVEPSLVNRPFISWRVNWLRGGQHLLHLWCCFAQSNHSQ